MHIHTGNRSLMGEMTNTRTVQWAGRLIVLIVVSLNLYLLIGMLK